MTWLEQPNPTVPVVLALGAYGNEGVNMCYVGRKKKFSHLSVDHMGMMGLEGDK
jgi:hypothetical protein